MQFILFSNNLNIFNIKELICLEDSFIISISFLIYEINFGNIIQLLIILELLALVSELTLVYTSYVMEDALGQVFALCYMAIIAAETATLLTFILYLYNYNNSIKLSNNL